MQVQSLYLDVYQLSLPLHHTEAHRCTETNRVISSLLKREALEALGQPGSLPQTVCCGGFCSDLSAMMLPRGGTESGETAWDLTSPGHALLYALKSVSDQAVTVSGKQKKGPRYLQFSQKLKA